LTWEFEWGEYDDEDEGQLYDWGFCGHFNDIRTEVTGYFYCFEYDEEKEGYVIT